MVDKRDPADEMAIDDARGLVDRENFVVDEICDPTDDETFAVNWQKFAVVDDEFAVNEDKFVMNEVRDLNVDKN